MSEEIVGYDWSNHFGYANINGNVMWNSDWKKGEDYPTWGDTDVYKKTISGG